MKNIKNALIILIISIQILLIVILISNIIIINVSKKYIYSNNDHIPDAYTVLVPGALVYGNGMLSPVLEDRVITALDLYKKGKIKRLLVSGDHGTIHYDEVNNMKIFLLKKGVSPDDIFLDHAGFETYDSLYRARDIFCIDNVIISTQEFHLYRAVFIGRMLGINTYGIIADRRDYVYIKNYNFREIFARVKTMIKLILGSKPKYLGDKIPINGDSRKSWD